MPLEDLTPSNRFELALTGDMTAEEASNRIEKILAGADIEPADRLEYFLKLRVSGGGGGGGGEDYLADRLMNTLTSYESESVTIIKAHGFQDCNALEHVYLPNVTKIESSAFADCHKVTTSQDTLFFPSLLETSADNAFRSCNEVKYFVAPAFNGSGPSCLVCTNLERIDIWRSTSLNYSCWSQCPKLDTVILRGDSVSTLQNTNVFSGTPFASGGSGGTLYVPQALISQYQAANNWSTILGYANNQIKAIEGSIYENAYADGTPIS